MSEVVGDARQLSPSAQEALRLRAVAALVAGRTREDVAAVFQVSLKAVDNWWAKWLAGGREALVAQPRGRRVGEHQVLDAVEQQAVRQAVLDHRPCDLGLAGQLWTCAGVGDLIANLYRVRLTEQGGKYLRRWGLSFQRPDKRAVEQSPEAVRVWREETWPAIRAKAKAEGGEVLFADQVGIRSDQVTGRTWGAKGCTPIVRRSGNRFSVNAMPAISPKGRMRFMVFTETFDADVMCRFLDRLAGHFDHKVHRVVDGHSAHRSRKVRTWLADHPDRIELHFLPSYSPELNPDELVNADLKRSLPMHSRARDQAQLAAETRRFFHRRQRQPHIVRGYFGGRHVRYILEWNPLNFGSIQRAGIVAVRPRLVGVAVVLSGASKAGGGV
ncbi:IS630 family transposase [Streptomyces luteogriseus]|uniref:IS630 family transposase n=1 Tax=Streptomyces luteogriseus TaxID=68233 RepID=UPI003818CA45